MNNDQKIDLILTKVQDIEKYLAGNDVRLEVLQAQNATAKKKIEELERNQYKAIGGLVILGMLATAFFSWLFKTH